MCHLPPWISAISSPRFGSSCGGSSPLLIGATLLRSPWFKGRLGEWLVKTKVRRKLPADTYHAFHDVTLADEAGSTQIDHLFVSPFGLFVVETKNYKGWIFGSAHSA